MSSCFGEEFLGGDVVFETKLVCCNCRRQHRFHLVPLLRLPPPPLLCWLLFSSLLTTLAKALLRLVATSLLFVVAAL